MLGDVDTSGRPYLLAVHIEGVTVACDYLVRVDVGHGNVAVYWHEHLTESGVVHEYLLAVELVEGLLFFDYWARADLGVLFGSLNCVLSAVNEYEADENHRHQEYYHRLKERRDLEKRNFSVCRSHFVLQVFFYYMIPYNSAFVNKTADNLQLFCIYSAISASASQNSLYIYSEPSATSG